MKLTQKKEIKANMIEPMTVKATFAAAELQDGDIVCFTQVLSESEWVNLSITLEEIADYV